MIIRRAQMGDERALAALRWESRTEERGERGLARDEFYERLAAWIEDHRDSHVAWLAEVDAQSVGMAWLAVVDRVPGPGVWKRQAGNVQSVYVRPAHRGSGVGAALVDAAIQHAQALGLDYLSVHPSDRSFSLYRRRDLFIVGPLGL